jgi:hypothetical protein
MKRPGFDGGSHAGIAPRFVARFVAQIHGDCWYSLVPIGTHRSSAVPTSPNSHKHNQDSNSLGGTTRPQVRGLKFPVSCMKSGDKSRPLEASPTTKPQLRVCFAPAQPPLSSPCCSRTPLSPDLSHPNCHESIRRRDAAVPECIENGVCLGCFQRVLCFLIGKQTRRRKHGRGQRRRRIS